MNDKPIYRDHTALKVTAGLTRAFALLVAAIAVGIAITTASAMRGALPVAMPAYGFWPSVGVLVVGLVYAAITWAAADVFIMLADGDDAHRRTHYELQQLRRDVARLGSTVAPKPQTVSSPPVDASADALNSWGRPPGS